MRKIYINTVTLHKNTQVKYRFCILIHKIQCFTACNYLGNCIIKHIMAN